MSEKTKIEWADSTVNFWSGCTKVSAGCANCYAETLSDRKLTDAKGNLTIGGWGKGAPRKLHESAFNMAVRLNRKPFICADCSHVFDRIATIHALAGLCRSEVWNNSTSFCHGCARDRRTMRRRRIFSLSLGDWLDPEVPVEWLARMLDTIRQCDQVTWILCTKRPELWSKRLLSVCARMAAQGDLDHDEEFFLWVDDWLQGRPPKHIILLASVENQEQADKRIPELLKIPAACRGLSLEPLLGPVDLSKWIHWSHTKDDDGIKDSQCDTELEWLIIGGESGHNARPCNVDWIRSLVAQGKAAGVAMLVKQLGAHCVGGDDVAIGQIKHPKGGDPDEWPADLRVRQWPEGF